MRELLPSRVEDMKEGVIYSDKCQRATMLVPCRVCGKPRPVGLLHGKPLTTRCHCCAMRTPEKRAIMSKAHKGIPWSPELRKTLEGLRSVTDNPWSTPEYREKMSNIGKGRLTSDETRRKLSIANKGKIPSHQCLEAQKKKMMSLFSDEEWRKNELELMRIGRLQSPPHIEKVRREKISKSSIDKWSDPEFKEKTVAASFKGRANRPTKPELALDKILQEHFPNQWIYNGDFSRNVVIGGLVADFINVNGEKSVIELFGDYFHKTNKHIQVTEARTEEGRIARFKEFGFNCLIIWESEMKYPEKVLAKLEAFHA